MPFAPLPNGIKITFVFNILGQPVTFTIYVTAGEPITTVQLNLALAAAEAWASTWIPALCNGSTQLIAIEALDVSVEDGVQLVQVPAVLIAGLVTGDAAPNSLAVVISWRTARVGRSYRGRTYFPGLAEGQMLGNFINNAYQLNLAAAANGLTAAMSTAGLTHVVASYWSNGLRRSTAVATPVIANIVNLQVDSQRRRMP